MTDLMKNEYQYNSNFRKYVDEYCHRNNCAVHEAFNNDEVKKECFGDRKYGIYIRGINYFVGTINN